MEENARKQAKQCYDELMVLVNKGEFYRKSYLDIASKYATLKYSYNNDATFELNGKEYTMYNSLMSMSCCRRFTEDLTMMVYKLNNGTMSYTPYVIEQLNKED